MFVIKSGGFDFHWAGGAYIEVCDEGSTTPLDVINVWDYAKDTPRISMNEFSETVENWLNENFPLDE